jgi:hypothetical protein
MNSTNTFRSECFIFTLFGEHPREINRFHSYRNVLEQGSIHPLVPVDASETSMEWL